jgi:hypothetical protein
VPDIYLNISGAEFAVVEPLIEILELRAADPGHRQMREAYLADVGFPAGARVVEVGCGHWSTIAVLDPIAVRVHAGDRRAIAPLARPSRSSVSSARLGGPGHADWPQGYAP